MDIKSLQQVYNRLRDRGYEMQDPFILDAKLLNTAALGTSEPSGPSSFIKSAMDSGHFEYPFQVRRFTKGTYPANEVDNTYNAMLGYGGITDPTSRNYQPNTIYSRDGLTNMLDLNKLLEDPSNPGKYVEWSNGSPTTEVMSPDYILADKLGAFDANTGEIYDSGLLELISYLYKNKQPK